MMIATKTRVLRRKTSRQRQTASRIGEKRDEDEDAGSLSETLGFSFSFSRGIRRREARETLASVAASLAGRRSASASVGRSVGRSVRPSVCRADWLAGSAPNQSAIDNDGKVSVRDFEVRNEWWKKRKNSKNSKNDVFSIFIELRWRAIYRLFNNNVGFIQHGGLPT